ncbi:MAG: hypothetical protein H6732_15825 [Alphaproteobacteria bacterium]|nr:hypothetical protein [Alphaproteobacteria bacterium]
MDVHAAWVEAVETTRTTLRARGEARWVEGTVSGAARWIDTALPEHARRLADEVVGRAVRSGHAPTPRSLVTLEEALDALADAVAADLRAWEAPRAYTITRRLVASEEGVLDRRGTDTRDPLGTAPVPDVVVVADDNRHLLRALARDGIALDAVVEDPPYATGSPDLPYDDAFPPGAWEALVAEHLALVHDALAPHGQAVLHIDEHRVTALQTQVRARFGDGHLGAAVWDKRNPKGDARGLAMRHEHLVWAVRDRDALWARGGLWRTKPDVHRLLARAAALVAEHPGDLPAAQAAWRAWLRAEPGLSEGTRAYRNLDPDGRVWRPVSLAWPRKTPAPPTYFDPVRHPVTGEPCPVPRRGWRAPPATLQRLAAEGRLRFGADHRTQPTKATFLDEVVRERVPSVIAHAGADDAVQARRGLDFAYAKPLALVTQLLEIAAPRAEALVLDGFGGSGTTAEAALRLTAGGHRVRCLVAEVDPGVRQTALLPRLAAALAEPWARGRSVVVLGPASPGGPPLRSLTRWP